MKIAQNNSVNSRQRNRNIENNILLRFRESEFTSKLSNLSKLLKGVLALFFLMILSACPSTDLDQDIGFTGVLTGHTNTITALDWSADGSILASGSADFTVRIWDAKTGRQIRLIPERDFKTTTFPSGIWSLAFSLDGKLAVGFGNPGPNGSQSAGKIVIMDTSNWNPVNELAGHSVSMNKIVNTLAFSPNGEMLASGGGDSNIHIWNPVTGAKLQTITEHMRPVFSLAWSPDGTTLASGGESAVDASEIYLWNPSDGTKRESYTTGGLNGRALAFSPLGTSGGTRLAATRIAKPNTHNNFRIWNLENSEDPVDSPSQLVGLRTLAFSPIGSLIATGGQNGTVLLYNYNAKPPMQLKQFSGHTGDVDHLVFSPDGKRFATAGKDSTIRIWAVQ